MSLSEHKNIEYTCLDDIYDELIVLYDKALEKGFDLGEALYTQSAFFTDYCLLISKNIQEMIKQYRFSKAFNCPPYQSIEETPDEIINNFLIIDSEHNNFQIQEQKAKAKETK